MYSWVKSMPKKVNENLNSVTLEDVEKCKEIPEEELIHDLRKLKEYSAIENRNSFYGNNFLYHFQLKNLLKCRREKRKTIYEIAEDPAEWSKLIEQTRKKDRGGKSAAANVFECYRINNGSIVMFKATTAKYVYTKYGAKKVLDPTAGWGGRLLGAWAKNIDYVGIDTNLSLKPAYDEMLTLLNSQVGYFETAPNLQMIWESCLNVDYSQIDYDFVLTSPPYINMEVYEYMEEWKTKDLFYKDFLLPLWEKCITGTKSGTICLNISPKMYDEFLKAGGKPCHLEEDLLQQLGQQTNKKRQDKIYIWRVS